MNKLDRAMEILAKARADLGHDLKGFSPVDLLLDNMPDISHAEATALVFTVDSWV